jgi:hypothetical protein
MVLQRLLLECRTVTLLLNLIGPRGIHQSSDFRLTGVMTRRPIEDEFASKQLHHMTNRWIAWISFTGFAQIGHRKTRDWILDSLKRAAGSADAAMAELAATAALELRHVPRKDWFLTIVATVIESGGAARLFVVSCVDRPAKPPLSQPLDRFEVHELSIDNPHVFIFGCAHTVTKADRKFLEKLNRGRADHAEIRRSLARVNARSAKRSNGTVSKGCFQPHSWEYTVDMVLDASGGMISIHRNSVALRSANFASPLPYLTESEELVVASSTRPALIKISEDQPSASACVEARLFLRDISGTRVGQA